jgi:hypothetical protein
MYRSKDYLHFVIAGRACCAPGCRNPAEHAHHYARRHGGGGVALKPHDTFTVPLCSTCHNGAEHQHGALPHMTPDETEAFFFRNSLQLVTQWLERAKRPSSFPPEF